jgi:eukaryotic-like serine/threonine-protein kinase
MSQWFDDMLAAGGAVSSPLLDHLLGSRGLSVPAGAQFGPFRVLEPLGSGGMATVYRAERVDAEFEQHVALKLLHLSGDATPDGATAAEQALKERLFRQERQILARLEHPGVARLIDGGRTPEGRAWLAMELIDGERIDDYVERHRLAPRAILSLLIEACSAVAYAHNQLTVHRDLKPSNVLVTPNGRVKVLDFGIAGLLDGEGRTGPIAAMTPGCASPEQLRREAVGVASDVFQLGGLLRTLVSAASIDADLAAVLARAQHADPTHRYRTVDALADELKRWLDRRPVHARAAGLGHRLKLFVRRHAPAVTVAVLASVVLLAIGATALAQIHRARLHAEQEAHKARAVSGFLASVFNAASPYANAGRSPSVDQVLTAGAKRLNDDATLAPDVRGELQFVIARVYLSLNQPSAALPLLRLSVAALNHDPNLPPIERAQRHRYLGVAEQAHRALPAAAAQFARAAALLDGVEGLAAARERMGVARAQAQISYRQGDLIGAINALRDAIAQARAALPPNDPTILRSEANLGQFLCNYGRVDEGLALLSHAHARLREASGAAHPEVAAIGGALGGALIEAGRLNEGAPLLQASIDSGLKATPKDSPWHPILLNNRGFLRLKQRDFEAAQADLEDALARFAALPPADDMNSVSTLESLIELNLARDRNQEALALAQTMIARNRNGEHAVRMDLGQRHLLLAQALVALGRCAEAQAPLAQAADRLRTRTAAEHPLHARLAALRAQCANADIAPR